MALDEIKLQLDGTKSKSSRYRHLSGYVFILPWLVGVVGLFLIPMLVSLYLSFTKYNLLSAPHWVGIHNYINMFTQDSLFWQSFLVTMKFVLLAIPLKLIFALGLAMVFNSKAKGTKVYTVIYYIPSMIGGSVAVAVLWRTMFDIKGPFNSILQAFGIPPNSWVNDPSTALFVIISVIVWQFGAPMIIFLAGLKNIPSSLYDSARVDGANVLQTFWKITIPLLSPVMFFNLVMQLIFGFLTFTQAYLITDGGPMNSTLLYGLYLYQQAFKFNHMGYASAMAWFILLVMALFTGLVFLSAKKWVYYER